MTGQRLNVLVTGGSGYVGQFLLRSLAAKYEVHYTYNTRRLASAPEGVHAHRVDLATGEGLRQVFEQTPFHAVINCAALSQPGACESAPEKARAVNVPLRLLDCLETQAAETGLKALLVHFSTDQVYDGSHSYWKEDEPCLPVNVYGRTKLEAEQAILSRLPETHPVAILRCSIIYGPPTPDPIPGTPFLQFVESALRGGKPTSFFEDEWRNPVYVADLQRLVQILIERDASGGPVEAVKAAGTAEAAGAAEATGVPGAEGEAEAKGEGKMVAAAAAAGGPAEEGTGAVTVVAEAEVSEAPAQQQQAQEEGEATAAVVSDAAAAPQDEAAGGAAPAAKGAADAAEDVVVGEDAAGAVLGQDGGPGPRRHRVYNMGGPERLSRVDMARLVADRLGCGHEAILEVPSSSAPRTIPRPADISVDMSRLAEDLGFHTTPMKAALEQIFVASPAR